MASGKYFSSNAQDSGLSILFTLEGEEQGSNRWSYSRERKDLLKWPTLEWCIIFLKFFQGRKTKMFPHCFLCVWICTHPSTWPCLETAVGEVLDWWICAHPGTWPCLETASGEVLDWWTTSHPFSTAWSSFQNARSKRPSLGRKQNGAPRCGVSKTLFSPALEPH